MPNEVKARRSFPLRLSLNMRRQANELAHDEGLSLNQFILLAIAEKIGRVEHQTWLKEMIKQDSIRVSSGPLPPGREQS